MALRLSLLRRAPRLAPSALGLQRRHQRSSHLKYRRPTLQDAEDLCRNYQEMSNDILCILAYQEVPAATRERLTREIMRVDHVSWEAADQKVEEMDKANDRYAWLMHMPHQLGVFLGVAGALVSIPLVFHKPTCVWFNQNIGKHDIPEEGLDGIETIWEVGSWSWEWMEPIMGTLSFLLLGLQFARANLQNMQIKPYTATMQHVRASRLAKLYPQYDAEIVRAFAKQDDWNVWYRPTQTK
eukprot:EG_transcript_17692